MKRVLFITTRYRTGEKIYPVIFALNEVCEVEVLNLLEMSPATPWEWKVDPRKEFYDKCERYGFRVINGPGENIDKEKTVKKYVNFINDDNLDKILGRDRYDLAICDNNVHVKRMRLGPLYQWFVSQGIPYIGSPHGNREYKNYKVLKRVGRLYDYSFVFGEKEKQAIIKTDKKYRHNADRLLPAGIPCNDKLKDYGRKEDYILVIPNFTTAPPKKGITRNQKPFTKKTFDDLDILKLSRDFDCPIVIKEKYRLFYKDDSLRKSLKKYSNIEFKMVVEDDNELISHAKFVISAPSTMAFKPIQKGVPTVVLRGQGMLGNLTDFVGVIEPGYKAMMRSFNVQMGQGRQEKFIKNTIAGGVEYNSTKYYVDYIKRFLEKEIK